MQNYTTSHYTITTVFDAGKLNRRVCPEVLADGMQWIDTVAESLLEMSCPNGFEGNFSCFLMDRKLCVILGMLSHVSVF